MEKDLFTFKELIDISYELAAFVDCTMLRDFGPSIKKGDTFKQIAIFPEKSEIEFYNCELDDDGSEIVDESKIIVKFTLMPI